MTSLRDPLPDPAAAPAAAVRPAAPATVPAPTGLSALAARLRRVPGWLLRESGRPWPGLCLVCGTWQHHAVCPACVARFAVAQRRCRCCALPLAGQAVVCGRCLRQPPPFARCVAAVDYGFPWDRLVAQLKFHQRVEHAAALAALLAQAARRDLGSDGSAWPDLLVPVPLWPARLRERGHNQAWELARRLGRRCGIAAHGRTLERLRDTGQQMALPRVQRLANLKGAFAVAEGGGSRVDGRCVALVDDVMTTGATAAAAAQALLDAGARQVQVWVLARTPGGATGG